MQTNVYDIHGKVSGKVKLPESLFGAKENPALIAQAVRVYLANQRKAQAKTKRRGEVRGSTRKIYRQKGTGRARHGDRYAPIFVGGGMAHGPRGDQNWKKTLSKKMRRQALASTLSGQYKDGQIVVVEGLEKAKGQTKEMVKILAAILKLKSAEKKKKLKVLLVFPKERENILRAARNIAGVRTSLPQLLNTYMVLNGGKIIFTKEAIKILGEHFVAKTSQKQPVAGEKL